MQSVLGLYGFLIQYFSKCYLLKMYMENSEDPDQTIEMHRLICIFQFVYRVMLVFPQLASNYNQLTLCTLAMNVADAGFQAGPTFPYFFVLQLSLLFSENALLILLFFNKKMEKYM